MRGRPALKVTGVSKRFGEVVANDGISLELGEGEILGLLGENGAGKTTLINIIFGHLSPDSGTVEFFGERMATFSPAEAIAAGVGLVHQHFTLADNLTVLENVILGTERLWALRQDTGRAVMRIKELAAAFGLDMRPEAKVVELSVGERQRVEILKALYRGARILILDEPTAVLTPQEIDTLITVLRQMAQEGLSIIFVSHKLPEVTALCDRVVVLRHGCVVAKAESSHVTHEQLSEAMVGRAVAEPVRRETPPGRPVLEIDGVTVLGEHGEAVIDNASLTVAANEIVGVAGVSGNGQVPLANLLSGLSIPARGEVRLFGQSQQRLSPAELVRLGVGRIPEDRHRIGVIAQMMVQENLILERCRHDLFSRYGILRGRSIRDYAQRLINDFQIRCPGPTAMVTHLSGGNMQKLILARVLAHDPRAIIASQPTRGLDIAAATYVRQKLLNARDGGCAILLITEDLDELLSLSDRVTVLYRGRLSNPTPVASLSRRQIGQLMSGITP